MSNKETMKLALEALINSVDLVVEDAYNAEKLYGNYPSRQAKVGGLKVLAENHKQAIKALEEALSAKQEQGNPSFSFQMQLKEGWGGQYPTAQVIGQPDLESLFQRIGDIVTFYTTPQQPSAIARKPLTTLERLDLHMAFEPHKSKWNAQSILIDMVEAAHNIKE